MNERKSWEEIKKNGFELSRMRIVLLQGGNICKRDGEGKDIGNEIADYIDRGGFFFFK